MENANKNIKFSHHVKEASNLFPNNKLIFAGVYGSINYGLDTPASDMDTRAFYAPNFNDIAFNKKLKTGTYILPNDEHIDYKDIRLFFEELKKQNLTFVEMLFTDYKAVNFAFENHWKILINNRELIARYNRRKGLMSMSGLAISKLNLFNKQTSNDFSEELGYAPKQAYHFLRIVEFVERFLKDEESYKDILVSQQRSHLINVKSGLYTKNEINTLMLEGLAKLSKAREKIDKIPNEVDKMAEDALTSAQTEIMKEVLRNLKEE